VLFVSLRDLQWRRRRFLIGVLAAGLVFALTVIMSGVSASFHNEIRRAVGAFHVDQWVVPNSVSGPFTSTQVFPESEASKVSALPGVTHAEPVALFRSTVTTDKVNDINLIGIVPNGIAQPTIVDGHGVRTRGDLVTDRSLGLALGRRVTLAGHEFTVVGHTKGITYFAGTPAAFVTIADLQASALDGAPLATAIVVDGTLSAPPPGFHVLSNPRVEADLGRPMRHATQTISFITVLLWIVAAGIIGSVLYLQAIERSRDFAVFKATGVTTRTLLSGLAFQAVVLALCSAIAATLLAFAIKPLMSMSVEVPRSAYVALPLVAIVIGLVASLVALRRAVTVDPALAFGG